MKRPIALLASLLAVTVLATAAMAAGGDSSDPLISLNYLQTTFTTKATSSIDAALDKADQAAYAKAEAALRSTIAAAEAKTHTAESGVLEAQAARARTEADVSRWQSEFTRMEALAKSSSVTNKVVDETQQQLPAVRIDQRHW